MGNFIFQKTLIIGVGLIGSSIARAMREHNIAYEIHGMDTNVEVLKKCNELNILTSSKQNLNDFSDQFNLIIILMLYQSLVIQDVEKLLHHMEK